jgi:hypothetical protein
MMTPQAYVFLQNMESGEIPIICKIVFLDFVHCLYFNNITFRKLDLLPFSGKKGKDRSPSWLS